jgi:tRNA(Ile)-lysidine synthase
MNTLFEHIDRFVTNHELLAPNMRIIIGLSGGPDSVALTHYLAHKRSSLSLTLLAAHVNHGWRPESDADALFCKELAQSLDIPLYSTHLQEIIVPNAQHMTKEEYARAGRRIFFEQLTQQHAAHTIALAHHEDDQIETFFIRLARGASLTGLCSMWPKDGLYIRPLLDCTKQMILDYLQEYTIAYRIDISNISLDFLRNRIRHILRPALQQTDARFDTTIISTIERLQEVEQWIEYEVQIRFNQLCNNLHDPTIINRDTFLEQAAYMQQRLLIYWLSLVQAPFKPSYAFLQEIIRFIQKPGNATHKLHQNWSLNKAKNSLEIVKTIES